MKFFDMNESQRREWQQWLDTRPLVVREMATSYPPDRLYRLTSSGHRVTIESYAEDGTCTVAVTGQYNCVSHNRSVFGVPIEELVECDLPAEGEPLGTILTRDEVLAAVATGNTPEERMEAVRHAAFAKAGIGVT